MEFYRKKSVFQVFVKGKCKCSGTNVKKVQESLRELLTTPILRSVQTIPKMIAKNSMDTFEKNARNGFSLIIWNGWAGGKKIACKVFVNTLCSG